MSNQTTSVIQPTIVASINNYALLIFGSTQSFVVGMSLPSIINDFSFNMLSMDMLNAFNESRSMPQVSIVGLGNSSILYQVVS